MNARKNMFARVALALALVVAQVLAQAHGYTHATSGDPFGVPAQACSDCLVCSPLLAGGGPPSLPVHFAPSVAGALPPAADAPVVDLLRRYAHRTRAPPALS